MNASNAWATIEIIRTGEAIVDVTTTDGRWLGGGLITVRSGNKDDLYEEGYKHASVRASAHGLTLDRYSWAA